MGAREMLNEEPLEEYVQYNKYDIVFTVVYAGCVNQVQMEAYLTPEEAHNAHKLLNSKIGDLVKSNSSISLSFIRRNADGEIVTSGLTGVVGIQHNIPQFVEVFEE